MSEPQPEEPDTLNDPTPIDPSPWREWDGEEREGE